MSRDRLREIIPLLTAEPWHHDKHEPRYVRTKHQTVCSTNLSEVDAEFIALARAEAPKMLAELDLITPREEIFQEGWWRSCTGCHESNEGHPTGPYSETFRCHLGSGCHECGGIGATWEEAPNDAEIADLLGQSVATVGRAERFDEARCPKGALCVHDVLCPGSVR